MTSLRKCDDVAHHRQEIDQMRQIVQYIVEISCDPCPEGWESQIARQLRRDFPVTSCRNTRSGLSLRLAAAHPFADGALKDFADLVGDTLTGLGIGMTVGVVRRVTRQAPRPGGIRQRMQEAVAALTGLELRPAREIPVLYFYKGLRFDRELSARLSGVYRRKEIGAF